MAQLWHVLDRLDGAGVISIDDERRVRVDIRGDDLTPQELVRLAQHLLEAAGASTAEAVMAIAGITFEPSRPEDEFSRELRRLEQLMSDAGRRHVMRRARSTVEENLARTEPMVPDEVIALLYRQGVVPSEIAEVMGLRLSEVIRVLENTGMFDE